MYTAGRIARVAGLTLSIALMAGCVPHAPLARLGLPPDQVATIEPRSKYVTLGGQRVSLVAIDGKRVKGPVEVLPGEHSVGMTVWVSIAGVSGSSQGVCYVNVTAEAGHRYVADADASNFASWRCWLEDVTTRRRIHGQCCGPLADIAN